MNKIWFTSDHHFGHQQIIQYAKRPFSSVEEMDEVMIERWNNKIGPKDAVYYIGDLALNKPDLLREILKRLNGSIYLIRGNHESAAESCKNRFEWIKDYYELKVPDIDARHGKQKIILFHYAIRQWNDKRSGSFHLYGHSHGTLPDDAGALCMDIGVDCHGFYPLDYQEVKAIMSRKTGQPEIYSPEN